MKTLDLREDRATSLVLDALRRGPIVLRLPTVFAVLAPATTDGVRALDHAKRRRPGKTYGSLVGDSRAFWSMALGLSEDRQTQCGAVEDVFFRVVVAATGFSSAVVRRGTHQGLLLSGVTRTLAREVEQAFAPAPELFGGQRYSAPLVSSWNISGDPAGTITELDLARALAERQGIGLFLTGPPADEAGSYTILEPSAEGVTVHRVGPGIEATLAALAS
jgi:hypothetical protein